MATISLHTKHSEHQPGTDIDKLFLPVHPIVVTLAMENLKRMLSTSTVALASKNEEKKHEHGWRIGTSHFSILPYRKRGGANDIFNEVERYVALSIIFIFYKLLILWFSF